MKIFPVLFVACIATMFVSSCQKNVDEKLDPSTPRPKTYTEDQTSSAGHMVGTYNLSYDASGRLTSMAEANTPGNKFVYKYGTNSYTMDVYFGNTVVIHETVFLNGVPYVDSTIQYNYTGDTTAEKYIYNSANQLIQVIEYTRSSSGVTVDNVTTYTYDSNGDPVKETDLVSSTTYDYYIDLPYTLAVGLAYYPLPKHLPKTTTISSGGTTTVLHHTYIFDSSKKLISETVTSDNGEVIIKSYTY